MHFLTRTFSFSSSHQLWNPELSDEENEKVFGLCTNVHGHNYRLEVTVQGTIDPANGFFCNVLELRDIVKTLIADPCEHRFLNDLPLFKGIITTMENLSQVIWQTIEGPLAERNMELHEVLLAETDENIVRLRKSL